MRAGEYHLNRYHPAATSKMIKEIALNCYWFLLVGDGESSAPLHCLYTVNLSDTESVAFCG